MHCWHPLRYSILPVTSFVGSQQFWKDKQKFWQLLRVYTLFVIVRLFIHWSKSSPCNKMSRSILFWCYFYVCTMWLSLRIHVIIIPSYFFHFICLGRNKISWIIFSYHLKCKRHTYRTLYITKIQCKKWEWKEKLFWQPLMKGNGAWWSFQYIITLGEWCSIISLNISFHNVVNVSPS